MTAGYGWDAYLVFRFNTNIGCPSVILHLLQKHLKKKHPRETG